MVRAECLCIVGKMSMGRREAYELFRRDYEHNDTIETNKRTLKQLCVEAKHLGEQLAESRNKISVLPLFVCLKLFLILCLRTYVCFYIICCCYLGCRVVCLISCC